MDAAEIIARLKGMEPELRRSGLASLYLFGSRARGDCRPDSDVDLLFEAGEKDVDLWTRASVMAAVTDRLDRGMDINLVDRNALQLCIRQGVEQDLIRVF